MHKDLLILCPKCEAFKFFNEFHLSATSKTGCYSCCKRCRKTMDAARYERKRKQRFFDEVNDVFDKFGAFPSSFTDRVLRAAYYRGERRRKEVS